MIRKLSSGNCQFFVRIFAAFGLALQSFVPHCEMDHCHICEKPGEKVCSGCYSVSYCSLEHQKIDWKFHKKSCKVFEVKKNEQYGRYTTATRDIAAGTIIMSEPALVYGPKQDSLPVCLGCNKRLSDDNNKKPKKHYYCSKCFVFPMCGPDCEKMPVHAENECKIFAKHKPLSKPIQNLEEAHPVYECIMTLRSLLLKENDPKKWKKLVNMQSQNEFRKNALPELWYRNEVNTVNFLRNKCQMKQFSEIEIHTVIGYSDINSFEVKINSLDSCAGLFDNTYIMSHDCISNTHHKFTEDYKMVVRAVIPIKKDELITTTYAHIMDGTLNRREELQDSKLFHCNCKRCSDPTELGTYFSALKCNNAQCPNGFVLPIDSLNRDSIWSCSECKSETNAEDVVKLTEKIKAEIKAVQDGDSKLIPHFENILEKYKNVLHPNHFLIIDMESSLLSLYGRMKGWMIADLSLEQLKKKENLCRHVLSVLDVIEPGFSRIRGLTLYELHAAIYFSAERKFEKKTITPKELKLILGEVLGILEESQTILSFDTPSTVEGVIAKSIPVSIARIKESIGNL